MNDSQLKELQNTSRIVQNISNLLLDCPIKGNDAAAVAECLAFLSAFKANVDSALAEGRAQAESKQGPVEVIDAEVMSQPSKG